MDHTTGDDQREVRELEDRIAAAVVARDVGFVERVWAEEFVYTGVRGEVKKKADILAEIKAGELVFDVLKFDDVRVQVYGDAAVATGRATTKGRSPQGVISGEFRYTRVYVKREGKWQLVAFQGTGIAAN
jgi:ketosteroid isomerase-like protein